MRRRQLVLPSRRRPNTPASVTALEARSRQRPARPVPLTRPRGFGSYPLTANVLALVAGPSSMGVENFQHQEDLDTAHGTSFGRSIVDRDGFGLQSSPPARFGLPARNSPVAQGRSPGSRLRSIACGERSEFSTGFVGRSPWRRGLLPRSRPLAVWRAARLAPTSLLPGPGRPSSRDVRGIQQAVSSPTDREKPCSRAGNG